jgi:hypothetical protein
MKNQLKTLKAQAAALRKNLARLKAENRKNPRPIFPQWIADNWRKACQPEQAALKPADAGK